MSPEGPRFPSESKSFENGKKEKSSKKKDNVRVPASILSLENKSKPAENSEPNPIEKALAELAAKRAEKLEKKTEGEEKLEEPKASVLTLTSESSLAEVESDEAKEPKTYEKLPIYEPAPTEFSGGEVIIHLNGDEPVAERVIPLQAEVEEEPKPIANKPEVTPELQVPQIEAQVENLEPAVTAGSGGETPPSEPPEHPTPSFEQPPEQPRPTFEYAQPRPEDIYQHPALNPNIIGATAGEEKVATKQELDDARYYARRAGQNSGLATGLFVGGLYEHFKHKRREKKAEKRFKAQTKELERERKDNYFNQQQQEKQKNEYERQYNALEKRLESTVQAEKIRPQAAERAQPEAPEQLKVPEDHRLETSAWHTIEVDAKTGRAVENPAFEYGHEYYRERAHENRPIEERDMAAGGVAVAASASNVGTRFSPTPPNIPSATTQGAPKNDYQADATGTGKSSKDDSSTSAPLWPYVVALVVIVVVLAFLLG